MHWNTEVSFILMLSHQSFRLVTVGIFRFVWLIHPLTLHIFTWINQRFSCLYLKQRSLFNHEKLVPIRTGMSHFGHGHMGNFQSIKMEVFSSVFHSLTKWKYLTTVKPPLMNTSLKWTPPLWTNGFVDSKSQVELHWLPLLHPWENDMLMKHSA